MPPRRNNKRTTDGRNNPEITIGIESSDSNDVDIASSTPSGITHQPQETNELSEFRRGQTQAQENITNTNDCSNPEIIIEGESSDSNYEEFVPQPSTSSGITHQPQEPIELTEFSRILTQSKDNTEKFDSTSLGDSRSISLRSLAANSGLSSPRTIVGMHTDSPGKRKVYNSGSGTVYAKDTNANRTPVDAVALTGDNDERYFAVAAKIFICVFTVLVVLIVCVILKVLADYDILKGKKQNP